jgi:hypothetical protein
MFSLMNEGSDASEARGRGEDLGVSGLAFRV